MIIKPWFLECCCFNEMSFLALKCHRMHGCHSGRFNCQKIRQYDQTNCYYVLSCRRGIHVDFSLRAICLQNGLSQLGSPVTAIVCSSLFFGYIHFTNGFPQGGLGVVLTILYGALVGAQFFYFKSASLTWLTHSLADAIMFFVILMNRQV